MHWGDIVKSKAGALGPLVLGIDPVITHAPRSLLVEPDDFLERYTTTLLNGAEGKVGFVKFQSAYFEAFGSAGIVRLARCIAIARERGFAIIMDAKRGDIGSTAEAYARAYLVPGGSDLEVDCLTINPFLGSETLEPFVDCAREYGKGLFVLVKTSNPGSGWLQDRNVSNKSVSRHVADRVASWADETLGDHGIGAVGAVVGATYPVEGQQLRVAMPRSIFLAPGLGVQGGDPAIISSLSTQTGSVLISASRGIAAIDDRDLPLEEYVALVRHRLDGFRSALDIQTPIIC
ncbi:MAG TPA: orotidine-5'-phosphate decarboxylase [Acidocella sp.]|jgi:orotidine-5'-phosphate decarboxylase|uniref:orotidine-5'-phosphate decarboxylase n=1 Tax=Acidocella sp. TaxID=50710 RepID=UPI002B658FD7|nr:orotidine-5'-phosphate decarboxylase [Acidocella sp.]HVE22970.1 orotidine-5'-phosphate decarboxylase [Acidocella sp.]